MLIKECPGDEHLWEGETKSWMGQREIVNCLEHNGGVSWLHMKVWSHKSPLALSQVGLRRLDLRPSPIISYLVCGLFWGGTLGKKGHCN